MKRYFCTYFDKNYLIKGLALIESLKKNTNQELTIYVICMDEITRVILNKLNYPFVVTIPMHEIEHNDHELLACKGNRDLVEYLWTTTPSIIYKTLKLHPEIDILTYVDADLYFYSSFEPIYAELGEKSVLIHPHRFPPVFKHQEKYGIFNVGLLSFRNNQAGREVLQWWRERCIEWCYKHEENGKFGDQGYLNDWPQRYSQVAVSQHLGVGVAPWNDDQYDFTLRNGVAYVNDQEIIFYHYHAFSIINPYLYIPAREEVYTPSRELFKYCVLPYIQNLNSLISKVSAVIPDFSFGIINNNFQLNAGHGFIAHKGLKEQLVPLNLPHKSESLDQNWDLYIS